jgi:hypothetical protein
MERWGLSRRKKAKNNALTVRSVEVEE